MQVVYIKDTMKVYMPILVLFFLIICGCSNSERNREQADELSRLILYGDIETAKALLSSNPELINVPNSSWNTPIYEAIIWKRPELVEFLLNQGIEVDIHLAATLGRLERVIELAEKEPGLVNAKNQFGETSLHSATIYDHYEVVAYLLDNGANVNARTNMGRTALHEAASFGRLRIAELLIEHGAAVNTKTTAYGGTPLHWASSSREPELVKLFISNGANIDAVNNDNETPLWQAVKWRLEPQVCSRWTGFIEFFEEYEAIISELVAHGADINVQSKDGRSPLMIAEEAGSKRVLEILRIE